MKDNSFGRSMFYFISSLCKWLWLHEVLLGRLNKNFRKHVVQHEMVLETHHVSNQAPLLSYGVTLVGDGRQVGTACTNVRFPWSEDKKVMGHAQTAAYMLLGCDFRSGVVVGHLLMAQHCLAHLPRTGSTSHLFLEDTSKANLWHAQGSSPLWRKYMQNIAMMINK